MNDKKRLEGWMAIAYHLNTSKRTAQRWEKTHGLPVYRAQNKGSVFAFEDELTEWFFNFNKKNENESLEKENSEKSPKTKKPHFSNVSLKIYVVLIIVFLLAITLTVALPDRASILTHELLHVNYELLDDGTQLNFKNQLNKTVLTLFTKIRLNKYYPSLNRAIQNYSITDYNNDGNEDIIFSDKEPSETNSLIFYSRKNDGKFTVDKSWDISRQFSYNENHYNTFVTQCLTTEDMNGDGSPEIILLQYNYPYYPSCCTVYTLQKEPVITIWHPGMLNNLAILDGDKNGVKELYIAGTNNFITEYSAPVFFKIECDWNQKNQFVDFFGENRNFSIKASPKIKTTYINLKKDTLLRQVSPWELASFVNIHNGLLRISASKFRTGIRYLYARNFMFDQKTLAFVSTFDDATCTLKHKVNYDQYRALGLLTPVYWNGENWQEEVCTIFKNEI